MIEITEKFSQKRNVWIDNVKVIACILVVLGHFYQSMTKYNLVPDNDFYRWFNYSIYLFHVPLFFICSGILYQKYAQVFSFKSWYKNNFNKFIILGVPYFTFSIITLILKKIAEKEVLINSSEDGMLHTLFLAPTAPYWYLYILFFIFLITPCFKNNRWKYVILTTSILLKILTIVGIPELLKLPYVVSLTMTYSIWFVCGMLIAWYEFEFPKSIMNGLLCFSFFIILSLICFRMNKSSIVNFALGLLACISVVWLMQAGMFNSQNIVFKFITKYNLPIFLMHTIFAAGLRSILFKIGIQSSAIHVLGGIIISFLGPGLAAAIMNKTALLNFFIYPKKFILSKNKFLIRQKFCNKGGNDVNFSNWWSWIHW